MNTGANDMTTNCLSQYATTGEARVARKLIRAALAAGYTVSVNDGGEWTVKRSSREAEILDAMCTTGEDRLLMRSPTANDIGDIVGSFWLIYGNDDSGEELISDHTDNPDCERLYSVAMARRLVVKRNADGGAYLAREGA